MSKLFFLTVAAAVLAHVVVPAAHILERALNVVAWAGVTLLIFGFLVQLALRRRL